MLKAYLQKNIIEAGCDEAGRGCLAGPVFASAVILPKDFKHPLLNDSKQINKANRNFLRKVIEENALDYSVSFVTNQKIDEINILKASILAMHQAVAKLKKIPQSLLIDGNRFYPYENIPHHCIVKGDAKFMSIAAASILAKTYRDEFMENAHDKFPEYNWISNQGYPTKEHRIAIKKYGITPLHRKTFRLLPDSEQIKFF